MWLHEECPYVTCFMPRYLAYLLALSFLTAACESRQPAEQSHTANPDATAAQMQSSVPAPAKLDTADASRTNLGLRDGYDTTFFVGQQRYRLLLRAEVDSTKPLTAVSGGTVGPAFAQDTSTFNQTGDVIGYEGSQIITLLDPTGRQVFRRRLRKADFYGVASPDIVAVSDPYRPFFVGYHAPSQTLAFSLVIGIPYSDVAQQCVIVLGFDGRVRNLATSYTSTFDAPDCEPRVLPDGTVLTCQDLLHPGGKQTTLLKDKSQIVAALLLSDTTLCAIYRYGEYRAQPVKSSGKQTDASVTADFNDPGWEDDESRRNAPNAFVLDTKKGRVLKAFKYDGYQAAIGYEVPRSYLGQTHTYYLLDEERGLYLLDKHSPAKATEVLFKQMQHFRKPQRPAEVRFLVKSLFSTFAFYVDPAHPTQLRYERFERPAG